MPLTDPKDTLAHHLARPFTSHRDLGHVPVSQVVLKLNQYMESAGKDIHPEAEALWFYGMNHGMALIGQNYAPLEPLPADLLTFVQTYHATLGPKAVRAFYYLLLICTREARHCKSLATDKGKIGAKFGHAMAEFVSKGNGEQGIHTNLMNSPPNVNIGTYVDALRFMFYHCKYAGGFGGPAWGKVTDCLCNFVHGTFTAEMMMDTIWTLCHNNGPIFNKGHLYMMHNTQKLLRILDIQRSGQIPQAILSDPPLTCYTEGQTAHAMFLRDRFSLTEYVDWFQVEMLGAKGHYASDQSKQQVTYGISPLATEMQKQKALAEKAAAEKEAAALAEFNKHNLEVYPGFVVKKFQPKRAA